jgi:hypothetical protein
MLSSIGLGVSIVDHILSIFGLATGMGKYPIAMIPIILLLTLPTKSIFKSKNLAQRWKVLLPLVALYAGLNFFFCMVHVPNKMYNATSSGKYYTVSGEEISKEVYDKANNYHIRMISGLSIAFFYGLLLSIKVMITDSEKGRRHKKRPT